MILLNDMFLLSVFDKSVNLGHTSDFSYCQVSDGDTLLSSNCDSDSDVDQFVRVLQYGNANILLY